MWRKKWRIVTMRRMCPGAGAMGTGSPQIGNGKGHHGYWGNKGGKSMYEQREPKMKRDGQRQDILIWPVPSLQSPGTFPERKGTDWGKANHAAHKVEEHST